MGFILPWSLFWRWGSVPPFNLVVNKKASGLFRSLAYGLKTGFSIAGIEAFYQDLTFEGFKNWNRKVSISKQERSDESAL